MTRLIMFLVTALGSFAFPIVLGLWFRVFIWAAGLTIIFSACTSSDSGQSTSIRDTFVMACVDGGQPRAECICTWDAAVDYYGSQQAWLNAWNESNETGDELEQGLGFALLRCYAE